MPEKKPEKKPENKPENKPGEKTPSTTSPILIAVAWLWVGLPLTWGVIQTISKTMDLFK